MFMRFDFRSVCLETHTIQIYLENFKHIFRKPHPSILYIEYCENLADPIMLEVQEPEGSICAWLLGDPAPSGAQGSLATTD